MIVLVPCDVVLWDEFNYTYKITGFYILECGEWITFNYTDKVEVWYNDKCCGSVHIDDEWHK
jgi:hypothetical protein